MSRFSPDSDFMKGTEVTYPITKEGVKAGDVKITTRRGVVTLVEVYGLLDVYGVPDVVSSSDTQTFDLRIVKALIDKRVDPGFEDDQNGLKGLQEELLEARSTQFVHHAAVMYLIGLSSRLLAKKAAQQAAMYQKDNACMNSVKWFGVGGCVALLICAAIAIPMVLI
jgi:hypothetical protein